MTKTEKKKILKAAQEQQWNVLKRLADKETSPTAASSSAISSVLNCLADLDCMIDMVEGG